MSAPTKTPPAGFGLAGGRTEWAPIRSVILQPAASEVAGEWAPIRAVVLNNITSDWGPIRFIPRAAHDIGVRVINQSNRNSSIGTPVLHESSDL